MTLLPIKPDPKLDLVLERVIDVPRELVFTAWTTPKHVKECFVPKPWTITDCEIDLRRGGMLNNDALAGGPGIPEQWLLPRYRAE